MNRQTHILLAKRFNVHPTTARGWIYRGLIGRKAKPDERKPEGRGRPCAFVITQEDIERFTPPDNGRPTRTPEEQVKSARRMATRGLGPQKISRRLRTGIDDVRKWINDIPRPNGGKNPLSQRLKVRVAVAKALRELGANWSEIARQMRVSVIQVHRWRKDGLFD